MEKEGTNLNIVDARSSFPFFGRTELFVMLLKEGAVPCPPGGRSGP